jgi:hypothetical protein
MGLQVQIFHGLGNIGAEKYKLEKNRSEKVLARLRRWIAETEEVVEMGNILRARVLCKTVDKRRAKSNSALNEVVKRHV